MVRVALNDSTGSYEPCSSESPWYALNLADPGAKEMYAAILSAKIAGQMLFVQSIGCYGTYSKITLVYICDTFLCT